MKKTEHNEIMDILQHILKRFDEHDDKLEVIDGRLNKVDERLDLVDVRLNSAEQNIMNLKGAVDNMHTTVNKIYTKIDGFMKKLDTETMERTALHHKVDRHDIWIHDLAKSTNMQLA